VAHDAGVAEEPSNVALAEAGDDLGVEPAERGAERLTLAEDRQPGEPGLEALERQPLVQAAFVPDRAAPLVVVVGDVERIGRLPAADQGCTSATTTTTTPLRTRTS
jgi:ureidoglycolate hydrolase